MKIALITDTHWGVRNDNVTFLDNSKIFLDNIFFPYLLKNEISTVIHLGDLVDRRKYVNYNTLNRMRTDFLTPLMECNIDSHFIVGNHDCTYKNTNSVNALNELVSGSYPFKIYDKFPKEVEFDKTTILMTPWICDENRKATYDKIRSTPSQIVAGHLELQGFQMYKGSMATHGDDPNSFERFDLVVSGHYHHRSSNKNIHYLGSHGEFTWSDYADPRGFHVLDTETRELSFIKNPYTMFDKIWYDDGDKTMDYPNNFEFDKFKNKIVKVIVSNKTNPYWFDLFIENLQKAGTIDLSIVEDHLNLDLEEDQNIFDEAESTYDFLKSYIGAMDVKNVDKNRLETIIHGLYNEALTNI